MKLSAHVTQQLSKGAFTVTLFSGLIGGHLTASYVLYRPDVLAMDLYMKIVLGILLINLSYFLICFGSILMNIPNRAVILKACLFMLINIPIAMGYLVIVVSASM